MSMDNNTQNEIQQLRKEIERLQGLLKTQQAPTDLSKDHDFIADLSRFSEGILNETDVRKKHYLSDEDWERLGSDERLIRAIEDEKIRRVRNGSHAREKAQQVFVTAPGVLDRILHDDGVSPRHKIESARELRAIAAVGPEAQPTADRFSIVINLGEDHKIKIDQPIRPNDKVIDSTALPMIAAKNREDDGSGEPI
jgi:hypothetical protein